MIIAKSTTMASVDLDTVRELCNSRDKRYTTAFYGKPLFEIIKPLLESVLVDGGIPCFIGEGENPLPESTATCLLGLYHLNIIDSQTIRLIQEFLFSTNSEVSRLRSANNNSNNTQKFDFTNLITSQCAWGATEGRNVWSTSQVLWALISTRYNGVYLPIILASVQ